ncbi:MAG: tetratricopeptide repeat protein [Pseudomonadota bacterium]
MPGAEPMKFLTTTLALILIAGLAATAAYKYGWVSTETEESYFRRAEALFTQGRFRPAVQIYQEYLRRFPRGSLRAEAFYQAGRINFYALDDIPQAVKDFGLLVNNYPASDQAYAARETLAGVFRDEAHDYLKAILEYKWLIKQRPENPRAPEFHYQAARCYLLMGNTPEAILELGELIRRYPQAEVLERAYDELGSAHLALGRPEQALYIFSRMIESFPESRLRPLAEFKMGHALEEMYRFSEALEIYQGLLTRYENRQAVEIRIKGVQERRKQRQEGPQAVDYSYRPGITAETLKNFKDKEAAQKSLPKAPAAAAKSPVKGTIVIRSESKKD